MKTSKLILAFSIFLTAVFCLSMLFVSATDSNGGITFSAEDYFITDATPMQLPLTFEATVFFQENTPPSVRGGIIFGSYKDSASSSTDSCINFEIHSLGNPRLYITNDKQENFNIVFNEVNVYNGKSTHIAITFDNAASVWNCYIDGELKQTINKSAPSTFSFNGEVFHLGGDGREGNDQYLKGTLQDLTLYSDIRTPNEIKKDYTDKTVDRSELILNYDLSDKKDGDTPETIECTEKLGPTIKYSPYNPGTGDWIDTPPELNDYAYSFALVGDTQILTRYYPDKLTTLYDWIVANKDEHKMKFVVGLGDITDASTEQEWEYAKNEIQKLNGVLPYSLVRGNHDKIDDYNRYISYADFSSTISGSEDQTMLNTYHKITVGKVKYLFLNLDLIAADKTLEWANKIVEDHPDYNVIITTHIYMSKGGAKYSLESLSQKYGSENNGDGIWNKLIKNHSNIVMLICGHNPTGVVYKTARNTLSRTTVTKLLVDPQGTDLNLGGVGLVAMLYFSEDGSNVQVRYYSTVKKQFYKAENQYSFNVSVVNEDGSVRAPGEPAKTEAPETTGKTDHQAALPSPNKALLPIVISATSLVIIVTVVLLVIKKKRI